MNRKSVVTLEGLESWFADQDEFERSTETYRESFTILRLIIALQSYGPKGRHRSSVIDEVVEKRRELGFPPTLKAEEYIQGRFQAYCIGAAAFEKPRSTPRVGLFRFPQGKGKGYWGLNKEAAEEWLQEHYTRLSN
jgi:hypothetical protein